MKNDFLKTITSFQREFGVENPEKVEKLKENFDSKNGTGPNSPDAYSSNHKSPATGHIQPDIIPGSELKSLNPPKNKDPFSSP